MHGGVLEQVPTWLGRLQASAWPALVGLAAPLLYPPTTHSPARAAVRGCSKLRVHLPHKVDADHGRARWDAAKKTLAVTLPILREDPF